MQDRHTISTPTGGSYFQSWRCFYRDDRFFCCFCGVNWCISCISKIWKRQRYNQWHLLSLAGALTGWENADLWAMTRVGSRRVVQIFAAFMIFFCILVLQRASPMFWILSSSYTFKMVQ